MTPLVLRPRRLVVVCWVVAVGVVAAFTVLAYALPNGATEAAPVRRSDQVAFFLLGCLIAAVPVAFTRARVRADERGVWIRNGLGERFLPWQVVVAVRLDEGAPWASLELQDDETKALLAVQANDGERAVEAVLALRRLLDASRRV